MVWVTMKDKSFWHAWLPIEKYKLYSYDANLEGIGTWSVVNGRALFIWNAFFKYVQHEHQNI